jgi:hypothetical protein
MEKVHTLSEMIECCSCGKSDEWYLVIPDSKNKNIKHLVCPECETIYLELDIEEIEGEL